eukprot:gene18112-22173_t
MAWLVRATEADETFKRRKDEEVVLFIQRLMPMDALRIRGRHNATNALAALGLAVAAGCNLAPMLHGLREYRGEPHRVESVAVIRDIEYFDDSKGTNGGATVAALDGLVVHLPAGPEPQEVCGPASLLGGSSEITVPGHCLPRSLSYSAKKAKRTMKSAATNCVAGWMTLHLP